jgi:hypothetical protein
MSLDVHAARTTSQPGPDASFVYCADCGSLHRVTSADQAPFFEADGSSSPRDDLALFLARHDRHAVRILRRASDVEIHSHPRHDPMRRVSWEVTDGDVAFVVTCDREDVGSPRRYTIAPARLSVVSESIDVDAEILRRVIDEAVFPQAIPPSRLRWLGNLCARIVRSLSWEAFEPVDEDRENPNVQLAYLPDAAAGRLREEIAVLFAGDEGRRLGEAIERELRSSIPVVRLLRRYEIVQR